MRAPKFLFSSVAAMLLLVACKTTDDPAARPGAGASGKARACEGMETVAHRGGPGGPENSLSAIRGAVQDGFDSTEIDVQRLADGRWVLHHDTLTGRSVTGGFPRPVGTMRLRDWRGLQLKGRDGRPTGKRPPTLAEALETISSTSLGVTVEIKGMYSCPAVWALDRQVRGAIATERVRYISVDRGAIDCLTGISRDAEFGVVVPPPEQAVAERHADLIARGKSLAGRLGLNTEELGRAARSAYAAVDNDDLLSDAGLSRLAGSTKSPVAIYVSARSIAERPGLVRRAADLGVKVYAYAAGSPARQARYISEMARLPAGVVIDESPARFCRRLTGS